MINEVCSWIYQSVVGFVFIFVKCSLKLRRLSFVYKVYTLGYMSMAYFFFLFYELLFVLNFLSFVY